MANLQGEQDATQQDTAQNPIAQGELWIGGVPASTLANVYGTPLYVYDQGKIAHAYRQYADADTWQKLHICYAVKANANQAVLKTLVDLGAGFDIVSIGELQRILKAGGIAPNMVYSGLGKTDDDIKTALNAGIGCINIESLDEIDQIERVASALGVVAPVALRINPDIDAKTHPYIATGLKGNKFGIHHSQALDAYLHAKNLAHIDIKGVACHIGSQITTLAPFVQAAQTMHALAKQLQAHDISLQHIDMGGGLGVCYTDESVPSPQDFLASIMPIFVDFTGKIIIAPGRSMVANAGFLLTKVVLLKPNHTGCSKSFAVVDAAMNDLIRPSLYGAKMPVCVASMSAGARQYADWQIVGQVCETGDFLAKDCELVLAVDDILCIGGAGAYGFAMASTYNSRPLCAEAMVCDGRHGLVGARQTIGELMLRERIF